VAVPTLLELLDFPDRDEIRQIILDELLSPNLPITDWSDGATVRTLFEIDAAVVLDLVDAITDMAYLSFLGTADEKGADGDWLTALAHGWYDVDRFPAQVPVQTISLVCAPGNGPYSVIPGTTEYLASDGSTWTAVTGGTVSNGFPLTNLDAVAASPGATRGLITSVVALPGVTVSGAALKVIGSTPQYGRDEERDASLLKRCNDRWPDPDATLAEQDDRVVKWAKAASSQVTRVRVDADPVNAGGVVLTLAGSLGPVGDDVPGIVDAFISARLPITDFVTVQNSSKAGVQPGGTVTVPAAVISQVQGAADANWNAYLAATQIGSDIEISRLIQAVMDAGAIDFRGWSLNGLVTNAPLGPTGVALPPLGGLTSALTWNGV